MCSTIDIEGKHLFLEVMIQVDNNNNVTFLFCYLIACIIKFSSLNLDDFLIFLFFIRFKFQTDFRILTVKVSSQQNCHRCNCDCNQSLTLSLSNEKQKQNVKSRDGKIGSFDFFVLPVISLPLVAPFSHPSSGVASKCV